MSETLALARALIERPSVTPDDAGCQLLIAERLARAGFVLEAMRFGKVDNLWARHGDSAPLLCFAGHTDVVPTGPRERWLSHPFEPTVRDGLLYGRGAADMKSSIAAMAVACERFVRGHPDHEGSVALLITSDEEGPAVDGTRRVIETLTGRGETVRWCLVGEPTSAERLGDAMRIGRRGSLTGQLLIRGVQGHVAYPQLAENPIHLASAALAELAATEWDQGTPDFPPTTFQLSNIRSGTGADNVIPGELTARFNFRHSPASSVAQLKERVTRLLERHELEFELSWREPSLPYLNRGGPLVDSVRGAVREIAGIEPTLSTAGGTSDGRFIAAAGAEVVELGPINASIHKVNESVRVADLDPLTEIYLKILERLLAPSGATSTA